MLNRKNTALATALIVAMAATAVFGLKIGGKDVVKLGTGTRSKAFLTVYYASLYAPKELKGKGWKAVLDADEPIRVSLLVDTRFMSTAKLISAIRDGFKTAAKSGYTTSKQGQFLNQFKGLATGKGDRFFMTYVPKKGLTTLYKSKTTGKTKVLGTVKSLKFKKALFAIWIGPNPVQSSLKRGMLGR